LAINHCHASHCLLNLVPSDHLPLVSELHKLTCRDDLEIVLLILAWYAIQKVFLRMAGGTHSSAQHTHYHVMAQAQTYPSASLQCPPGPVYIPCPTSQTRLRGIQPGTILDALLDHGPVPSKYTMSIPPGCRICHCHSSERHPAPSRCPCLRLRAMDSATAGVNILIYPSS